MPSLTLRKSHHHTSRCPTVDLGEIHLSAVTTNTGKALVISGRGICTLKRQHLQRMGKIARK